MVFENFWHMFVTFVFQFIVHCSRITAEKHKMLIFLFFWAEEVHSTWFLTS